MSRGPRRRARHSEAPRHWTHRLAGLPWITLVLVAGLLVAGVELMRTDRFAAQAVLSAATGTEVDQAREELGSDRLARAVEDEVELGEDFRGDVRLAVLEGEQPLELVLEATSTDPRLAALAADTAVALVVQDHPAAGYDLAEPADVPTDPVRTGGAWWVWLGLLALAGALWMEGAHRVWLRDHPDAVAEGAR